MQKQIIASGGDGFLMSDNHLFDCYILSCSEKKQPKICFLPTASGDNPDLSKYFVYLFNNYGADASYLNLIEPNVDDIEDFLMDQDIIYVGGGNTKSMLGIWREWGVDSTLKKAYDKGIILSGISAGSVCWFDECLSDCYRNKLTVLPALGFIKGSNVVHFSKQRRFLYEANLKNNKIKPGYACTNFASLHFVDGELHKAIKTVNGAYAEYFSYENNEIYSKNLNPEKIEPKSLIYLEG